MAIAIVSVLAAIATPGYARYRQGSLDATVQSTVYEASVRLQGYVLEKDGPRGATVERLIQNHGLRVTEGVELVLVIHGNSPWYHVLGYRPGASGIWWFDSRSGIVKLRPAEG